MVGKDSNAGIVCTSDNDLHLSCAAGVEKTVGMACFVPLGDRQCLGLFCNTLFYLEERDVIHKGSHFFCTILNAGQNTTKIILQFSFVKAGQIINVLGKGIETFMFVCGSL